MNIEKPLIAQPNAPSMGIGLAALGRPGYINLGHGEDLSGRRDLAGMEANAYAVLDLAWKRGIRYVDAARSYGKSEFFLSGWLKERGIAPDEITVGSKWGYRYTADWQVSAVHHEVKEHTLAHLDAQWMESQALLSQHLDLYQIHSATLESGVLSDEKILARLHQLKATHGVRMGLSLSGPDQWKILEKARLAQFDGIPLFDAVQATCNILEPSAEPALADAARSGMAIIVKEALANGRLTQRNTHPDSARTMAVLTAQAARLSCSVDALAIAWVFARPWVSLVLSGAACTAHLESNLTALDVAWDDEADAALRGLVESPQDYWSFRKGLAWN